MTQEITPGCTCLYLGDYKIQECVAVARVSAGSVHFSSDGTGWWLKHDSWTLDRGVLEITKQGTIVLHNAVPEKFLVRIDGSNETVDQEELLTV